MISKNLFSTLKEIVAIEVSSFSVKGLSVVNKPFTLQETDLKDN